jgi:hypothetical protein
MLKWLKSLFGGKKKTDPVVVKPAPVEVPKVEPKVEKAKPVAKPKAQAKKPATKSKKSSGKTCDFDKLTKKQLLAEAKHRGVKANASMSKAAILEKVKSAK